MIITFNGTDLAGETRGLATVSFRSRMRQGVEVIEYAQESAPDLKDKQNRYFEFAWRTVREHATLSDAITFAAGHGAALVGNHVAVVDGTTYAQAMLTAVEVSYEGLTTTADYQMLCSSRTP